MFLRRSTLTLAPPGLPGQAVKKRKHSLVVWERLKYQISLPVSPGHARHWETKAVMPVERPIDLRTYGQEGFKLANAQFFDGLPDPVVRAPEEYPPELFDLGEWSALSFGTPASVSSHPYQVLGRTDISESDKESVIRRAQHLQLWQELYMDGPFLGTAQKVVTPGGLEELTGLDGGHAQVMDMKSAYQKPILKKIN